MKQLIKQYLNVLNEDKNFFGFQINDHTFQPFEYKKIFCAAAATNKDLNYVLTQLFNRTNNTLNDVFIVLKRGIDKFIQLKNTKYKDRRTKSFHIISKQYCDFKLAVQIVRNDQKDIFKYLENLSEFFFNCDYICFLYTVLTPEMNKKPLDDDLFVENSAIYNSVIKIYVD